VEGGCEARHPDFPLGRLARFPPRTVGGVETAPEGRKREWPDGEQKKTKGKHARTKAVLPTLHYATPHGSGLLEQVARTLLKFVQSASGLTGAAGQERHAARSSTNDEAQGQHARNKQGKDTVKKEGLLPTLHYTAAGGCGNR